MPGWTDATSLEEQQRSSGPLGTPLGTPVCTCKLRLSIPRPEYFSGIRLCAPIILKNNVFHFHFFKIFLAYFINAECHGYLMPLEARMATHLPRRALLWASRGLPRRTLQPGADLEADTQHGRAGVEATLQKQHKQQQQQQHVIDLRAEQGVSSRA